MKTEMEKTVEKLLGMLPEDNFAHYTEAFKEPLIIITGDIATALHHAFERADTKTIETIINNFKQN